MESVLGVDLRAQLKSQAPALRRDHVPMWIAKFIYQKRNFLRLLEFCHLFLCTTNVDPPGNELFPLAANAPLQSHYPAGGAHKHLLLFGPALFVSVCLRVRASAQLCGLVRLPVCLGM